MSSVPATSAIIVKPVSTYNGVKIKVNNPSVNAVNQRSGSGNFNSVDIEVNNPKVNTIPVYHYPPAKGIVTAENAGFQPVKVQSLPVNTPAYSEEKKNNLAIASVPAPNFTNVEAEKNLSFNGLDKVEIVKPTMVKQVDINTVISKLADKNFDVQAVQLAEIAQTATEEPIKAIPYIVTDVYTGLADIINAETSRLEKPTEAQMETRKKIIINQLVLEDAIASGKDLKKVQLPYDISDKDRAEAVKLSAFEQAERNKEYAILTTALLTGIYIDENKRETGVVTPLTDLPGVSVIVDVLRRSKNQEVKMAAIDALGYISRPEYNKELKAVFELAATDENPYIAERAKMIAENL